jgi:hypothetical protein
MNNNYSQSAPNTSKPKQSRKLKGIEIDRRNLNYSKDKSSRESSEVSIHSKNISQIDFFNQNMKLTSNAKITGKLDMKSQRQKRNTIQQVYRT